MFYLVIKLVIKNDFSDSKIEKLQNKTFNEINPFLQLDDIAHNTGYVKDFYNLHLTNEANKFIINHIINIIRPIVKVLDNLSMDLHEVQTTTHVSNYPTFPYFGEFFTFISLEKPEILRRRRWTNF